VKAIASAPGKVILVGEHFVVEGVPAIAAALNLRTRVTAFTIQENIIRVYSKDLRLKEIFREGHIKKDSPLYPIFVAANLAREHAGIDHGLELNIESELPLSAGMGSSAAVSVATAAAVIALKKNLEKEVVSSIAYEAEKIVHKKPSGIDNTISTYGGAILYSKNKGFEKIEINLKDAALVLADTGIPRNTGVMVEKVRKLKARYGAILDLIYASAEALVYEASKAIEVGDVKALGELMNINHGLLSAIGVSIGKLEELIYTARQAGAVGAKITGAGGGGLIVALCYKKDVEKVENALSRVAQRVYVTAISKKGVALEHKN